MVSVPSSGTASVRWSMPTSISVPTEAAVKHDDRGQHAAQQVGAPRGVVRSASCHDVPARPAAGCASAAVQRSSTGARVARPTPTRMPAGAGGRHRGVRVVGVRGHGDRDDRHGDAVADQQQARWRPATTASGRPVGRGLGERQAWPGHGWPGGRRPRRPPGGRDHASAVAPSDAGPPPNSTVDGDHAAVAQRGEAGARPPTAASTAPPRRRRRRPPRSRRGPGAGPGAACCRWCGAARSRRHAGAR